MKFLYFFLFFYNSLIFSQIQNDSIVKLSEVVVESHQKENTKNTKKASVETFLEQTQGVNFVKRGAYACEPILHNMLSERALVTIDGMRIFNACTDKMDPTTSYVELNNLADIDVHLGQTGAFAGANIAGNIDLKQKKATFSSEKKWSGTLNSGAESNNSHRFFHGNLSFSAPKLASSIGFSTRKADNYQSGNGLKIKYSQFSKKNFFYNLNTKLSQKDILHANLIYDRATNIGFPSLPMDTSLAEAFISMITHEHFFEEKTIKRWLSKVYYNRISHQMDDSYRDQADKLPIKMDMPGKSSTTGLISEILLTDCGIASTLKINAFENISEAQMTMYYSSGGEMFTYTWPNIQTISGGFSSENVWKKDENTQFLLTTNLEIQQNYVKSDMGYRFNQVFHQFKRKKQRFSFNLYGSIEKEIDFFIFLAGIGYGERPPSVSEGYGFYIFNSADGFDYIGNPNLKNEKSFEGNIAFKIEKNNWKISQKTTAFLIKDYIFGIPKGEITWQMTPLGANKRGIKIYENLENAQQLNISIDVERSFSAGYYTKIQAGYAYGQDFEKNPLPFIRPLFANATIGMRKKSFWGELFATTDAKQTRFSKLYGEDETPAYIVLNGSAGYTWAPKKYAIELLLKAENLLNTQYSTYADWNNLPRMGRNISVSTTIKW